MGRNGRTATHLVPGAPAYRQTVPGIAAGISAGGVGVVNAKVLNDRH